MQAAVDGLVDPLSDPLPGLRQPAAPAQQAWYDPQTYDPDWSVGQSAASTYAEPVRRAHTEPAHGHSAPRPPYTGTEPQQPYTQPQPQPQPRSQPQQTYTQPAPGPSYAGPQSAYPGAQPSYAEPQAAYAEQPQPYAQSYAPPYEATPAVEETVALRIADAGSIAGSRRAPASSAPSAPSASPSAAFSAPSAAPAASPGGAGAPGASGGRAARRKASGRHGRHGGSSEESAERVDSAADGDAPASRMAARRAARARKPGAAVMASRMIGEVFITTGVLMLLFVTYQLWWTNVRAHAQAGNEASNLQEDWAKGKGKPGTFEPGQGFALLHIPKLDVVVPIAEGTDKKRVLDRGMVGHYAEEGVKTAMPDAKTGNFGLAGHRNTHGEPFRYINRLKPGDPIVVETQDKYFVYKMASILPVTSPSNTSVLDGVPKGSPFKSAGRYITLTTCTPEFTSKYRMIVWGTMVEERSRDKGKPDELVG
nr:class E sortase [Streptomyces aurantiacus]